MRRTVSHFFLVKVALIHTSGLPKKCHASSTAYNFCWAMSFTLKFSGIQIEHVLKNEYKISLNSITYEQNGIQKTSGKKTFTLFYQGSKIFSLSPTSGKKCSTFSIKKQVYCCDNTVMVALLKGFFC